MKVKTNAGEVVLTAEMVRPGMVFEDGGRRLTATEHVGGGVFRSSEGIRFAAIAVGTWDMVGCNPTIAARADCERYGIAPGIDAGAHGFARLRDGGAVDLRREHLPNGSITYSKAHGRTAVLFNGPAKARPLWGSERFVGLNGRHACREDMGRLCCDAVGPEQHNDEGCPWTPRCTLAIGGHDEHENIAKGVRWSAKVDVVTLRRTGTHERMPPSRIVFHDSSAAVNDLATLHPDGTFTCACGSTDPAEHREGCALPWWYRMSATWALHYTNACGEVLSRATAEGLLGAVAVALLAWCLSAEGHSERARRAKEAPLVALVTAVPEGLDPIGWRAAVLSVCEGHIYNMRDPEQAAEFFRSWPECAAMVCQFARSGRKPDYDGCALRACNAYARAIAPQGPRPAPFRRKAPGLPVDIGDE